MSICGWQNNDDNNKCNPRLRFWRAVRPLFGALICLKIYAFRMILRSAQVVQATHRDAAYFSSVAVR